MGVDNPNWHGSFVPIPLVRERSPLFISSRFLRFPDDPKARTGHWTTVQVIMMLSFDCIISGCYLGAWCRGYHARSVLICEGLIRSCVINIISSGVREEPSSSLGAPSHFAYFSSSFEWD